MKKGTLKKLIGLVCVGLAFSAGATTWTYTTVGEDKAITDNQWTLKISSLDEENGEITIGSSSTAILAWTTPAETSLSGVLDLRDLQVVKEGVETPITIKSIKFGQSSLTPNSKVSASLLKLYCNNISSMGSSCFSGNGKMTEINISGTADTFPGLFLNNCAALKTVNVDFPDLRMIGDRPFGASNNSPDPIDVSKWATPGVTNIYGYLSSGSWRSKALYGDLVLTNATILGANSFFASQLTNVYLKGDLTILNEGVFQGSGVAAADKKYGTITNLVFDLPKLATVHANAFKNQNRIRRVEFVTPLDDMNLLANIVGNVANTTVGELCIYVSKKMWKAKDSETYSANNTSGVFASKDTLTTEEKATIDAGTLKNVIGVFVKGGEHKGIFVHKASIYEKATGFAISVR